MAPGPALSRRSAETNHQESSKAPELERAVALADELRAELDRLRT